MATTISELPITVEDRAVLARPPRSLWSDAWRRLSRNHAAVGGMIFIAILFVVALAAPLIAPHNPIKIYPGQGYRQAAWIDTPNQPRTTGTWEYPLGTDSVGRDVLSRLIYGTRTSLVVGFVPMLITIGLGALIGLISGYAGGNVDLALMRFAEIVYSFPAFLFFIIMMTALRDQPIGKLMNGFLVLFIALALVGWVHVARLVRGQVLALKEKEFIEAARTVGVSRSSILLRHLFPNTLGPIVVSAAFIVPGAIITEAALSFLGIGLRPATNPAAWFPVSWGNLILDGRAAISSQPALLVAPAIAIALITLAFTFVGDGLNDALDPRSQ